jgi:hypothetical protein
LQFVSRRKNNVKKIIAIPKAVAAPRKGPLERGSQRGLDFVTKHYYFTR